MKYEYDIIEGSISQEHLNTYGQDGWELVAVAGDVMNLKHYFKRTIDGEKKIEQTTTITTKKSQSELEEMANFFSTLMEEKKEEK